MSELKPEVSTDRWGPMLLWFNERLGRLSVQLPLLLGAGAYLLVKTSDQGKTALQFPVERPGLAIFVVGMLSGISGLTAAVLSMAYRRVGWTERVVPFWRALDAIFSGNANVRSGWRPRMFSVRSVLMTSFVLALYFGSGVMSVAYASGVPLQYCFPILLGGMACGNLAMPLFAMIQMPFWWLVTWPVRLISGKPWHNRDVGFTIAVSVVTLATVLYAGGIYLVTHDLGELVVLGPHAVIVSGLLVMALFFQGIVLFMIIRATLRALWLVFAICIGVSLIEAPLSERVNPYLVTAPSVQRASSVCSTLAPVPGKPDATSASSAAEQKASGPSILISAEGGGIRAAYWTAVSLEEFAEARGGTLAGIDVLSGVSGGSLGVATFLAAQDLPLAARLPCIRKFLSGDFLSPLVAGLLFLDVPRLFVSSWILDTHRGDYFEEYIARRWLTIAGTDYFYRPLKRAAGKEGSHLPSVFFNATDALSGQYVALAASDKAGASDQFGLTTTNAAVLKALPGLRIAQAVHMSARFPFLSPTPDLRVKAEEASQVLFGQTESAKNVENEVSLVSLVDGGYFDNSGLWPTLRLLEYDQGSYPRPQRFVIHIVNDQLRTCEQASSNSGCIHAGKSVLEGRGDRGGWLLRPSDAIQSVRTQHSLQSITTLRLTQSQLKGEMLVWPVKMPPQLPAVPGFWGAFISDWLPVVAAQPADGARDPAVGVVALGWTLAPSESRFLCIEAAKIRARENLPGIADRKPVDRTTECSSQ